MKFFVTFKVQVVGWTNYHDGYCSGNECVYEEIDDYRHFTTLFEARDFINFLKENNLVLEELTNQMTDGLGKPINISTTHAISKYIAQIRNEYVYNRIGSYYCKNSEEAEEEGIEKHENSIDTPTCFMVSVRIID